VEKCRKFWGDADMRLIRPGQTWEVYRDTAGRWERAVIVEVEGGIARLVFDGMPLRLKCPTRALLDDKSHYRCLERSAAMMGEPPAKSSTAEFTERAEPSAEKTGEPPAAI
jgi:hypothetical protein